MEYNFSKECFVSENINFIKYTNFEQNIFKNYARNKKILFIYCIFYLHLHLEYRVTIVHLCPVQIQPHFTYFQTLFS